MPDQLRTLTFDVRADFKISPEPQREYEQRLPAFLTELGNLIAQALSLTTDSPVESEPIRQHLRNAQNLVGAEHDRQRHSAEGVKKEQEAFFKSLYDSLSEAVSGVRSLPAQVVSAAVLNEIRDVLRDTQKRIQDFRSKTAITREPDEKQIRVLLSEKTQTFNERIERELRRQLPPYVSVLANVQFEQGSVIALGTVALLSWAGSIVLDATKEEAAKQLSELVKIAVGRSIHYVFEAIGQAFYDLSGIEMNVVARDASTSTLITAPTPPGTQPSSAAVQPPTGEDRGVAGPTRPQFAQSIRPLPAAIVLLSLILLLQLVLLFDRFFTIHPRGAVPAAMPSSSGSPTTTPHSP